MIGFYGLSHLGTVSAIATAAQGHDVVAADPTQPEVVAALQAGKPHIHEPDLVSLLDDNKERISFSAVSDVLGDCEIVYFSFDVPTSAANESDMGFVESQLDALLPYLSPHTILIILSQVRPGFCRSILPRLRKKNISLVYQVETLIFGRAVERAMKPERFILGLESPWNRIPAVESLLLSFNCPIIPMRYESAELCKTAINMFLISSVTTSNMLAELCESIGANWQEIIPALRLDRRIGKYAYLAPGLGIAGGNLERDIVTLRGLCAEHGCDSTVLDAWDSHLSYRKDWALRTLSREVLSQTTAPRIAVLGISYKKDTHSVKNSSSVALLSALDGFSVVAYDPAATIPDDTSSTAAQTDTAAAAFENADVLLIMTPWDEFALLTPSEIASAMRGNVVIDPFCVLDRKSCRDSGLQHFMLGVGRQIEIKNQPQ